MSCHGSTLFRPTVKGPCDDLEEAILTQTKKSIDYYSLVSLPLKLIGKGFVNDATGFFYERNGKSYLVSNWHVFSGRNTYTGQPMRSDSVTPDEVRLDVPKKESIGRYSRWLHIQLGNNDYETGIGWLQHPRGQEIDLAVIPLPAVGNEDVLSESIYYYAVGPEDQSDMAVMVAMDVFVVGFPLGLQKQGNIPVWKRGSIASEPNLDADGLPLFLIDTATREGMSGSPVYARAQGGYISKEHSAFQMEARSTKFLGVYSGRYGAAAKIDKNAAPKEKTADQEFSAQLGRVWRKEVLDELIDNAVPGEWKVQ